MISPNDIAAQPRGYWLLDLTIGGRVYRLADGAVTVTEGSNPGVYDDGLGPVEYTQGSSDDSLTVDINGVQLGSNGKLALTSGKAATAVVSRYWPGKPPMPVLQGAVDSPSFGVGVTEGVTITIIPEGASKSALWPADTLQVSTETCPITGSYPTYYPDQDAIGMMYPVIFGRPGAAGGLFWDGQAVPVPATPAYLAEYGPGRASYRLSKLVIAGHRVAATSVVVHDRSGGYNRYSPNFLRQTLPVSHTTDRLGQTVAYISGADCDGSGSGIRLVPGNEYVVEWPDNGVGVSGGLVGPRGELLRGAGDIVAYILSRSGVAIDEGRSAPSLAELNRFQLDFGLTERIKTVEWVSSVLGEILGFRVLSGPGGLYVLRHRMDCTKGQAIAVLEVGRNCERSGKYTLGSSKDIANEVVVSFAPAEGREGKRTVKSSASTSALAALSTGRYGVRTKTLDAPVVYSATTAQAIAVDQIIQHAIPRVTVNLSGGSELETLMPGDVVLYTDGALWVEELAVVGAPTIRSSGVEFELTLVNAVRAGR